jgi:chemotaxis methyl-accepting protein methylase
MFIQFLDNNNLEKEINSFILLFSINDTEFVREELNKYLNYFMKIKNILNK